MLPQTLNIFKRFKVVTELLGESRGKGTLWDVELKMQLLLYLKTRPYLMFRFGHLHQMYIISYLTRRLLSTGQIAIFSHFLQMLGAGKHIHYDTF